MFIDAACVYGEKKSFSVSINTMLDEDDNSPDFILHNGVKFKPFDLNDYSVRFQILGSATADADVLVDKLITQNTDLEEIGQITNAANGEFSFTVSKDDTIKIGLGKHPIKITLVDIDTLEPLFTLTEGGENEEFNKIFVVQV